VIFFLVLAVLPLYWMALTAFKTNDDLYNPNNFRLWFNPAPTLQHFQYLFNQTLFLQWLANTYIIAAGVVIITLLTAVPAGYGLARLDLRGANTIAIILFLTYLVPTSLLFIPLSRVISFLNLQDSLWALIVVYPTITIPFTTWLMTGFFKAIPREIEEAALVDGANRLQSIWHVILPLSKVGLFTVTIFAFTLSMQDFIYMLSFISSSAIKPVTLGVVTDLVRGDVFYWGELMAGALIGGLPVAILYNFFLDDFISGLTSGAIK
jgi:multiple sugar transport system permease protein